MDSLCWAIWQELNFFDAYQCIVDEKKYGLDFLVIWSEGFDRISWVVLVCQVLLPCGVGDFVCGRASEWISNGTELCRAAGFTVSPVGGSGLSIEEKSCYGGKASLDSIAESWKTSQTGTFQKDGHFGLLHDFQQWVIEMPFTERVSWAVGGLVLTAGLFFFRLAHFLRTVGRFIHV